MANEKKTVSIILGAGAALTSVGSATAILWIWDNKLSDYSNRYNYIKNVVENIKVNKDVYKKIFHQIDPVFKRKEQFKQLDQLVDKMIQGLRISIQTKEANLKNTRVNTGVFSTLDDLLDINDSLDNVIEFDSLINQLQDKSQAQGLKDSIYDDLKFSNTSNVLNKLKELLKQQQKDIEDITKENAVIIAKLPDALKNKLKKDANLAKNNLEKLKDLSDKLKEYERLVDKAKNINNIYDRNDVYADLSTTDFDDLKKVEDKIDALLAQQNKTTLDKIKDELKKLNDFVKDDAKKQEFDNQINDSQTLGELNTIRKDIEDFLKQNSGEDGLINTKKLVLKNLVKDSDLSADLKEQYLNDIDAADSLSELDDIETELDSIFELLNAKKDAKKIVSLLNNPKRDELIAKINASNSLSEINKIASDTSAILSDEKRKTLDAIAKLKGDPKTKNDFETELLDAKKQQEFIDIKNRVLDYLKNLKDLTKQEIDKIDTAEKQADKQKLNDLLSKLGNDATAGEILDILDKAKAIENFEEAKKQAIETLKKVENKNNLPDETKLNDASDLDELLKLKSQIDKQYNFEQDKKAAKAAVEKIKHAEKKKELNDLIDAATTSTELINVTNQANSYAKIEDANDLTAAELTKFTNDYVENNDDKTRLLGLIEAAKKDAQGQPNINQNEIEEKLINVRNEINKVLNKEKEDRQALKLQKEQLRANINKIQDLDKANEFRDQLDTVTNKQQADALSTKIDELLTFERYKDKLIDKINKLNDQKDYFEDVNTSENINELKELEKVIDADLAKEAKELAQAQSEAKKVITKLSNSNPLKVELFEKVDKAKSPQKVDEIKNQAQEFLDNLKQKAQESIAKTIGDDNLNNNLKLDFGGADSEVAFNDIIKAAENAFGDKKTEVINVLDNLSDDNQQKQGFKDRLIAASNIAELNKLKQDIIAETDLDNAKNSAKELNAKVQETAKHDEFETRINGATSIAEIDAIKQEIQAQIDKESAEIQANKDTVRDLIPDLYKENNITIFTNQINDPKLGLQASRDLIDNIKTTIALEQSELDTIKQEAEQQIRNRLKDGETRQRLEYDLRPTTKPSQVQEILNRLDAEVEKLREAARTEAKKLINSSDLITNINQANTQETIDGLKEQAITYLNLEKDKVKRKLDEVVNVSTDVHSRLDSNLTNAITENDIVAVSQAIDTQLITYNNETKRQVNRLNDQAAIISQSNWTSEGVSKQQRDEVARQINAKLDTYKEKLTKLQGDEQNHSKYANILVLMDKNSVPEAEIDQYIAEMSAIYKAQEDKSKNDLDLVTNQTVKATLQSQFDTSNTIADHKLLQDEIALQLKKEAEIAKLPNKIVFADQRQDFENRLNQANTTEAVDEIVAEIDQKKTYNDALVPEINASKNENNKIDVNNDKHQDFANQLDLARTNEEVARIKQEIQNYLQAQKDLANASIAKLEGREGEKTLQTNNLSSAITESQINSVTDSANQFFATEQDKVRQKIAEIKDGNVADTLTQEVNNAPNISELDKILDKAKNQVLREFTQSVIDKIQDSDRKQELQIALNQAQTTEQLNKVKSDAEAQRISEGQELQTLKDQAREEIKKLADTNAQKPTILNTVNTTSEIAKVKKALEDIKVEIAKLKTQAKSYVEKVKPSDNRENEVPQHKSKYDELIKAIEAAESENEIENIKKQADNYLKDLQTSYVNKEKLIPASDSEHQSRQDAINATQNVNDADQKLKDANDVFKNLISNAIDALETEEKKNQFKEELKQITDALTTTTSKFVSLIEDLQPLYTKVESQKQTEQNNLAQLKNEIQAELTKLNDSTALQSELNAADTSAKAQAVRGKINQKIAQLKTTAQAIVEKTKGDNLYNTLKQQLNDAQSEAEILRIQNQAQNIFDTRKNEVQAEINTVRTENKKQNLNTELGSADNVEKLNALSIKTDLNKKQEDLLDKVNTLRDKKNYVNDVNSATTAVRVAEIERLVDADIAKEAQDLAQAKQQAQQVANLIKDKTQRDGFLARIDAANDPASATTVKNEAQAILDNKKQQAQEALKKLVGHTRHQEFSDRLTNNTRSEDDYDRFITEVNNLYDSEKANAQNTINNTNSPEKQTVLNEFNTSTNYQELEKAKNAALVYHKAAEVKAKLDQLRDKTRFETRYNNIHNSRPQNNNEKDVILKVTMQVTIKKIVIYKFYTKNKFSLFFV
ncbi:hypothetical protein [Mycoplasma leonicaptivi]|uniref:hypothetical protein n=1 Tax=Mycoplasma leonicaptivi TaxID=36742 RepID=UPI00048878CC|nr:hypothetical protein [Mycoplasma leonicaptivi]